jgi:hypothetical protein
MVAVVAAGQLPSKAFDFFALVGGEAAAASLIKQALAFVRDRVRGATVLVLSSGQLPTNATTTNWLQENWIDASASLIRLSGVAAEARGNSCNRFLQVRFFVLESDRIAINFMDGNRCEASGPAVVFDRVPEGWSLNREKSGGEWGQVITHCDCR